MSQECLDSGMDFFLSKPIRRPALKHVLKTYCPTIPEEDSDTTPPGSAKLAPKTNCAVVVPAPGANTTAPFTIVSGTSTSENRRADESPAVSPMTSPPAA